MRKSFLYIISVLWFLSDICNAVNGIFEFPNGNPEPSRRELQIIDSISSDIWLGSLKFGSESIDAEKRLEENLLKSEITIQNGSLSHAQLLDTLPNSDVHNDSHIALKILKSSIHLYHTICLEKGISAKRCSYLLSKKQLPENSELYHRCNEIRQSGRDGHHPFRRLLQHNYKDGFYMMYSDDDLPSPREISAMALESSSPNAPIESEDAVKSLGLVQWAQFIEHDLSKPVVTSMSNGQPIECCNKENYELLPRYRHTACAPLLSEDSTIKYGRETCLNYVRSALAIGESCTFGAAEQLNQATGYFDLSQLYGFTKNSQAGMRSFQNGRLKSTDAIKVHQELLPVPAGEYNDFCAFQKNENNSLCFMAGDSRVNSNPFAIAIYTVFLRNHNQIAQDLKTQNPNWDDEKIFQAAKSINIDIYRRIIFTEWLKEVLGPGRVERINSEQLNRKNARHSDCHVSNEFAVAAIRFYFSMMPNALYSPDFRNNNEALPDPHIFLLEEQMYTPNLMYSSTKIDEILQSLLDQGAMKMDSTYVASLIPDVMGNIRPTHTDVLAFDTQRGRDHGLQPYYKYAEICNNIKITTWKDLEGLMSEENIRKIKRVYKNWTDIDLIVGGISESPLNGAVGPTFACIIEEQFSKIRQWHHSMRLKETEESLLQPYKDITAAKLLCQNTELKFVPQNPFRKQSINNPMMSCADGLEKQLLILQ